MKWLRIIAIVMSALAWGVSVNLRAEDIDIYVSNADTSGVPNVLFVLDNGANFESTATNNCKYVDDGATPSLGNTAGGIEQCAIYNAIYGLKENSVNIGLMVFESNNIRDWKNNNCGNSNGGCLVVPLTAMTPALKAEMLAWIRTWKTSGGAGAGYIKSNTDRTGAVMQEAWAYYAGSTGLSGRSYAGIQPPSGCQKNFVIFIGNAFTTSGSPGDGGSANIKSSLSAAPGVTSALLSEMTIPSGNYGTSAFTCGAYSMPPHNDGSGLYADEWARYMYGVDIYGNFEGTQSITTYTIGVMGPSCKPDYPALLTNMAKVGGGKYFGTSNYDELKIAIDKILNEVQAVNSVFSSASLPVSVNAQGTYENQIFLGMFRPDPSGNPRWVGNLKQYQFILEYPDPSNPDPNTATLKLGDKNGSPAISSAGTGFITPTAVSFWTSKNTGNAPDSTGGFFINDAKGAGGAFDSPDGEVVEKGGSAQQTRLNVLTTNYTSTPSSPRKLYTYCPGGASTCYQSAATGTPLSDHLFATSNSDITAAMLASNTGISVSSITRSGTVATATTSGAHGFAVNDTVFVSGASPSEYSGTKTVTAVPTATTFTFTVPEYPPSPATGTYSVTIPSNPKSASITRVGNTVTVTSTSHGYITGQQVTVAGTSQSEYNGTFVVTNLNANQFSYTISEQPEQAAGSGTAKVLTNSKTIDTVANGGVTRAAGSTTVRVTTTSNHGFATGNTVQIAGVVNAGGTLVSAYNGTFTLTKDGNKGFTFQIPSSAITPATPATGAITVDSASVRDITSLTRTGTTATATTAGNHGFVAGQKVNVGGTAATNEGAYVGTVTIVSAPTVNSFTYTVVTTPTSPATLASSTAVKVGASERAALINWVRGEDNAGDEASPGSGYTVRPSVHGDVLHSRPLVINYGDDRGTIVFYGANDGVYRAVNGSKETALAAGSVAAGGELWGLVLPEHFTKLNRQRLNSPELKFPSTTLASALPKDYFVDGPTGAYQKYKKATVNGKEVDVIDKAYIYLTMRRGGRFIYALDVSTPTAPKFMWKIDESMTGFSELGQTWSRPRLTVLKASSTPVLIFGGGYDPSEDSEPPTANTMGRGVYVVNAETGARVWSAVNNCGGLSNCTTVSGMTHAIPGDVTFMDRNNDAKTDRIYAADVGGNVWRIDADDIDVANWTVTKLAALGCDGGACAAGVTPRKFFFPPSVVPVGVAGTDGSFEAVLVGSGDREHPLKDTSNLQSAYNVTNRFYMIKDTATGTTGNTTPITQADLVNATSTAYTLGGTDKGFYATLATGEKVVNAPITLAGTTYFGTNRPTPPSANSCGSNLGQAKGYGISPFTAAIYSSTYDGGGLPPSPTAGLVTIPVPTSPGSEPQTITKQFCIGCGGSPPPSTPGATPPPCNSALENCVPNNTVPRSPRRTYWYKN